MVVCEGTVNVRDGDIVPLSDRLGVQTATLDGVSYLEDGDPRSFNTRFAAHNVLVADYLAALLFHLSFLRMEKTKGLS